MNQAQKKLWESPPPDTEKTTNEFLDFVNAAVSPFHAVDEVRKRLLAAGFECIREREAWDLRPSGKYFFTRNQSTIVAFAVGGKYEPGNGFSVVAAHTDSPNLQVKPVSTIKKGEFLEVGVQTYGGGMWHTWFDRDLTIAGRVMVHNTDGSIEHKLCHIKRPILRIPNLAIHLTTDRASGFKPNDETHLLPILASTVKGTLEGQVAGDSYHHPLLLDIMAKDIGCKAEQIGDFEMSIVDTQPACVGGAQNEFIFSPRLDNLAMSFCGMKGLIAACDSGSLANETQVRLVALFDHEEVGSASAEGADSTLLHDTVRRVAGTWKRDERGAVTTVTEDVADRSISRSYLMSADMAHASHPNYSEKHEDNHRPVLHKGIVIKTNAKQRYATNAVTSSILRAICAKNKLPLQEFVVRNDSPCGSTIGPIIAHNCSMRTIDVGTPQLSMHSIREMCGTIDMTWAYLTFKAFFEDFAEIDQTISVD